MRRGIADGVDWREGAAVLFTCPSTFADDAGQARRGTRQHVGAKKLAQYCGLLKARMDLQRAHIVYVNTNCKQYAAPLSNQGCLQMCLQRVYKNTL